MALKPDRAQLIKGLDQATRYGRIPLFDVLYGVQLPQRDFGQLLTSVQEILSINSDTASVQLKIKIEKLKQQLQSSVMLHIASKMRPFEAWGIDERDTYVRDNTMTLFFPGNAQEYLAKKDAHKTVFLLESGYMEFLDWLFLKH
jgi:hypothetical protein